MTKPAARAAACVAVGLIFAAPVYADRTWDRGAGTNNWSDAANWNPDGVPTSADAAFFTDTGAGTVDLNGISQPVGSGSLLGVTFNNATTGYTVNHTGGGTIFTNALTNSSGSGVVNNLTAPFFVTNGITVNSGTLAVNATLNASAASVNGGTLRGTGSISSPVSVGSGGTVAPGNSIGTFSTGSFSVASAGGTLKVELDPQNSFGLGTADNLNVTGSVTLTGGNLSLSPLSSATVGQQFQILTNDGADPITGTFLTANGSAIAGNTFSVSGTAFSINYAGGTGNDVVLTVNSVPEPAAAGLLAAAAVGAVLRRRRHRV